MTTSAKDARSLLAVTLGDAPLVPDEVRRQSPSEVVAAALRKLVSLRRERGRLIYHRRPDTPAEKGPLP